MWIKKFLIELQLIPKLKYPTEMEVIHRFNGTYPFYLEHQTELTYLEVLKQGLTEQQIVKYKQKYKILKEIDQTHLIKLVKLYRQQTILHLLYEYYSLSLEKYVQHKSQQANKNERGCYKDIHREFVAAIDQIIANFIEFQIKTDICINNIAVVIFIDPDAQFLALNLHNEFTCQQQTNNQIKTNKRLLSDFYSAQKKRLVFSFEEWLQKYFGKQDISQPNHPNFVINGTKLVFINQNDHSKKQHKQSTGHDKAANTETKNLIRNSPNKIQKERQQIYRDLKEKNLKKVQEIKNVLNRFDNKTPQFNNKEQHKVSPPKEPQKILHQNVNSIIFKEKTPDKAHHFENLPQKVDSDHKIRLNKVQRTSTIKQSTQFNLHSKNMKQPPKERGKDEMVSPNKQTINQKEISSHLHHQTCKNPHEAQGKTNETEIIQVSETGLKVEKVNKYKMKITTSHEIQFEGSGDPEIKQIEKDIFEGIKSGRINLYQFPEGSKQIKIQKQQVNLSKEFKKTQKNSTFDDPFKVNSRTSDISSNKKMNEVLDTIQSKSNLNQNTTHNVHQIDLKAQQNQQIQHVKIGQQGDHKAENFTDKIRQAKLKAEQVLKQYAKKKH